MTFFLFYAGLVFTAGWALRLASSYSPANKNLYIAQTVFILAGPPIYAGVEYNILGRLMHYLPQHAPLHPHRVVIVFIYLGALVESLTAAGASKMASSTTIDELDSYKTGSKLVSIALVLQGVVECFFVALVATIHRRCIKTRVFPKQIRSLIYMLYGTSALVLLRCIFRAIESFGKLPALDSASSCRSNSLCELVEYHEWYLFAFEGAPMVLYTFWLNIIHPGKLLPRQRNVYLDPTDGKTERLGPGWIDRRRRWETFADPLDFGGMMKGQPSHEKFWERPEDWPVASVKNIELSKDPKGDMEEGSGLLSKLAMRKG